MNQKLSLSGKKLGELISLAKEFDEEDLPDDPAIEEKRLRNDEIRVKNESDRSDLTMKRIMFYTVIVFFGMSFIFYLVVTALVVFGILTLSGWNFGIFSGSMITTIASAFLGVVKYFFPHDKSNL